MVINYSGENFKELVKDKVLVDFYARWCGPCKLLGPELEKLDDEVKIVKVDIDKYRDLARSYGVMSIPCLVMFNDGEELKRSVGFMPESKLREFIK